MIKGLEHLSYEENLRAVSAQPGKKSMFRKISLVCINMGCVCKEDAPMFFSEYLPISMILC